MTDREELANKLAIYWQLSMTNKRKAFWYYSHEVYPMIRTALLDKDTKFLYMLADVVDEHRNRN